MAVWTGLAGSIEIGNELASLDLNRWTVTATGDTHDVTPFGAEEGWAVNIPGKRSATGSADGFVDTDSEDDVPLPTAFNSTPAYAVLLTGQGSGSQGLRIEGSVLITNCTYTASTDEPNSVTVDFVFTTKPTFSKTLMS